MTALLRAVRGATTVEHNDAEEITRHTQALVKEVMTRNEIVPDDLVSMIFTATPDITAAFPATAARALGLNDVPLLGAAELGVVGGLDLCIRVLIHCYSERGRDEIRHVYLEGAKVLRSDLAD